MDDVIQPKSSDMILLYTVQKTTGRDSALFSFERR
jgi:hypothetical protein